MTTTADPAPRSFTTAASSNTTTFNTAATALELVERSRHSLLEACQSSAVAERYLQAQLAALRAAAALVAARTGSGRRGGPSSPCSMWELVPAVAPELTEWAGFFELASKQGAQRPQTHHTATPARVTARDADDLLRQAETFLDLVCRTLGLPVAHLHGDVLVPTALAGSVS